MQVSAERRNNRDRWSMRRRCRRWWTAVLSPDPGRSTHARRPEGRSLPIVGVDSWFTAERFPDGDELSCTARSGESTR